MANKLNIESDYKWWEDEEKWGEFCKQTAGMKVKFKNTLGNSTGSIGVIRDAIIKHWPFPRLPMPVLIIDFPDSPYKEFSLDSVYPVGQRLERSLAYLEGHSGGSDEL